MSNRMSEPETLRRAQAMNPWWTGHVAHAPSFTRSVYRECVTLLREKTLRRAIMLRGPRRVGKSTVLRQLAQTAVQEKFYPAKNVLYMSLDDAFLGSVSLGEVVAMYRRLTRTSKGNVLLLLDEIQDSPQWELELKQLVDHHPDVRVFATGSASIEARPGVPDRLVGRIHQVDVLPLSFYEFLALRGELPDFEALGPIPQAHTLSSLIKLPKAAREDIAFRLMPIEETFSDYLIRGGFPEAAQIDDMLKAQELVRDDIVDRVVRRDLPALFGIRDVDKLMRVFLYLCMHSGSIVETSAISSALETSAQTVNSLVSALEAAFLAVKLPPHRATGKKQLKPRHKYYLPDAGLFSAVMMRGEDVLTNPAELGLLAETAIVRHMRCYAALSGSHVTYWRDAKTQREVDAILTLPRGIVPHEVKYREDTSLSAKEGLSVFCAGQSGEPAPPYAVCVTKRHGDFSVETLAGSKTPLLRIPAHIYCYLAGWEAHEQRARWVV